MHAVVLRLVYEPLVWIYFILLGGAAGRVLSVNRGPKLLYLGLVLLCIRWWYLARFTHTYLSSLGPEPSALLDAAYQDALDHFGTSARLLTWAVPASIALADNVEPLVVILGMLGAMSTSAAWGSLLPRKRTLSPWTDFYAALIALYSITHLRVNHKHFGFWLRILHLALAVPCLSRIAKFSNKNNVEQFWVYGGLALALARIELRQLWPLQAPLSDCQLAMCIDLVGCTLLSALQTGSWTLLPAFIIAPGTTLATVLALKDAKQGKVLRRLVARLQAAMTGSSTSWTNLGLIEAKDSSSYEAAGRRFALVCLKKVPKSAKSLLCVGCGRGAEVELARELFGKEADIVGIDPCFGPERLRLDASQLRAAFYEKKEKHFDAIVAIDSAHHFPAKTKFFQDCVCLTEHLVFTDILSKSKERSIIISVLRVIANAPYLHWTRKELKEELLHSGFDSIDIKSVSMEKKNTFLFFELPTFIATHLDHVVVTATRQNKH